MRCKRLLIAALGLGFLMGLDALAQEPQKKPAADESANRSRTAENESRATQLLRSYQTIRIETGTWLAKPEMCEGALQKHKEFDAWELSIVRSGRADVILAINHQPGWFYYQYSLVDTVSQVVLASGNVTAWDGTVACSMVSDEVIKRTKQARPVPKPAKDQKDKKNGTMPANGNRSSSEELLGRTRSVQKPRKAA